MDWRLDSSYCINVKLSDFVNCAVIMKEIDLDFEIYNERYLGTKGHVVCNLISNN